MTSRPSHVTIEIGTPAAVRLFTELELRWCAPTNAGAQWLFAGGVFLMLVGTSWRVAMADPLSTVASTERNP